MTIKLDIVLPLESSCPCPYLVNGQCRRVVDEQRRGIQQTDRLCQFRVILVMHLARADVLLMDIADRRKHPLR